MSATPEIKYKLNSFLTWLNFDVKFLILKQIFDNIYEKYYERLIFQYNDIL